MATPNSATHHDPHKGESETQVANPQPFDAFDQIVIKFIDQSEQRYPTVGDWYFDDSGNLVIIASRTEDKRMQVAVAMHELFEALLCTHNGVTPQVVDEFDMGQGADYDEPGKHPSAPYHKEHIFATALERKIVNALGLTWEEYDATITDKGVYHGNEATR